MSTKPRGVWCIIAAMGKTPDRLLNIYRLMLDKHGPQRWWPAESPFECAVGAILTQNTNWTNVEKAIDNLKCAGTLSVESIDRMPQTNLAGLIRPSGYFNQKARRLKILSRFIMEKYGGDIGALLKERADKLRDILLSIEGIGPETADSIALYAAGKPLFVVDAYTKRITTRHGLTEKSASYDETRNLFMENLPRKAALFNEYHALVVRTAKEFCHKREPECEICPLKSDLPANRSA